jgi:cytochrome c-type biogenesis protein
VSPAEIILNGSLIAAIPLALIAGVISFVSPCVLPLIPGYLGYISGVADGGAKKSKIIFGSVLFVLGFTAVFVSFGALFGGIGMLIYINNLSWVQQVLGVLIILMGFVLIGQFSFLQRTFKTGIKPKVGLVGAPILGVAFGLGWTPCIGPTLAAVLTLASDAGSPSRGALLALLYSLGIGLPFIAIAAGFGWATSSVAFVKRHIRSFNIAGGVLLIALGLALATGVWVGFATWLQGVFGVFVPAL